MSKQILLTVFLFVVAMGSGIVIGWNIPRDRPATPRDRSWLENELKLSPEQREKMKSIWAEVLQHGGPRRGSTDPRRQLSKERDEAIAALITPAQKAAYDQIAEKYNQRVAEMGKEREATFQRAVEQTKAMLDAKQRARYEELMAKGSFPQRRPGSRPATTQAAVEATR